MAAYWEPVSKTCSALGIKPTERILVVQIGRALMHLHRRGEWVSSFPVSTSRRPPSNVKGSLGTPRGLHEIAERIGGGQPPGIVFRARVSTGRHFSELPDTTAEANLITSRILWLRGLEPGVNRGDEVDTFDRYVYIHGTNQESRIGEPLSSGCVLMRNLDIIALYEEVRAGDMVWIED